MSKLVLDATTKTIVAVMSGAPATTQPDFVCTWADNDGTTLTEGSSDGALNGVTQATLIAAPAASTRRIITGIRIENRDTADVTITVKYNNNGTLRFLAALTFSPGEVWTLDGTYDANGALMTAEATTQALGTGDSPQFAGVNLGHASDTTLSRISAGVAGVEGVAIPTISSTNTLTNKRITARVSTEASNATPAINADSYDEHTITALGAAATFGAPTGTPTEGQKIIYRIKDNATARALSWNAIYRAMGTALPSTTVLSKTLYLGFIYNNTDSKWDLIASAQEA